LINYIFHEQKKMSKHANLNLSLSEVVSFPCNKTPFVKLHTQMLPNITRISSA